MVDPQLATVLTVETNVPAPVNLPSEDLSSVDRQPSQDATVSLRICSEFTTYIAPVSIFSGRSKFTLIQDSAGQSFVFSVGDDKRLYCLQHENGANQAWQSYDITPGSTGASVVTFDSQQSPFTADNPSWLIVAAAVQTETQQELYTFTINANDFRPASINWAHRPFRSEHGPCVFDSVSCGGIDNDGNAVIVVGTEGNKDALAVHHTIPSSPDGTEPHPAAPPEPYETILDIQPGRFEAFGPGSFVLYRRGDATKSFGCTFDSVDNEYSVRIKLDGLGHVNSICSANSPNGECTDLFVAAQNGIGFYHYLHPDHAPEIILPSISVKQVAASEYGETISVLAVSEQNELYFIQGARKNIDSSDIAWTYSGLPIRSNVARVSAQFNIQAGGTELMYTTNAGNEINHLWRSPDSSLWNEAAIHILPALGAKQRVISYPAYVTRITVVNSKSHASVGGNYPCSLASDWTYVTVNERTWMLSKQPVTVVTDSFGCLEIVQKVGNALATPSYELSLSLYGSASITIQPTQRVITQLARYTTAESIQNAKTSDGRPIQFSNTANFGVAATTLSQFSSIVHTVDEKSSKQLLPDGPGSLTDSHTIAFTQEPDGNIRKSTDNWFENAAEVVVDFIGDIWEATKRVLKTGFKFALKAIGRVVSIVVSIESRIFSFVIKTVASALRSFAGFLKNALGIDITRFLDWFGYIFDVGKIKETQQVINQTICAGLTFSRHVFTASLPLIENLFEHARQVLQEFVPDHRFDDASTDRQDESALHKAFGFILDNPLVNLLMKLNPMPWLAKQASDIIGDDIKLPDLSGLFKVLEEAAVECAGQTTGTLGTMLEDIARKFSAVVSGRKGIWAALTEILGDAFWTLFDIIRVAVKAIWKIVPRIIEQIVVIITDPIKLPIVTDIWKAFLGDDVPLTLLNALTILPAFAANAFYGATHGKMPFAPDAIGDSRRFIPSERVVTDLFAQNTPKMFKGASTPAPEKSVGAADPAMSWASSKSSDQILGPQKARSLGSAQLSASAVPNVLPSEMSLTQFIDWVLSISRETFNMMVSLVCSWITPVYASQDLPGLAVPDNLDPNQPLLPWKDYRPPPRTLPQIIAGSILLIGIGVNMFVDVVVANYSVVAVTTRVVGFAFQATGTIMAFLRVDLGAVADIGVVLQYGVAPIADALAHPETDFLTLANASNAAVAVTGGAALVARILGRNNNVQGALTAITVSFGGCITNAAICFVIIVIHLSESSGQ
ncbi:hypothetical protein FRC08_018966 [Ceratobasidium sp. 394]|nr:hypothetical protein FRC08_018966 [Ceratobasidium sp. 394]